MKHVLDLHFVASLNRRVCQHPRMEEEQHILVVAVPWAVMARVVA
jgi:hypothetical protein